MNEARLVQAVDPGIVALKEAPALESSTPTAAREVEAAVAASAPRLGRALLISLGIALLLAGIAFWPSGPEPLAPRPALRQPIVFDVLNAAPLPQATPPTAPSAGQK